MLYIKPFYIKLNYYIYLQSLESNIFKPKELSVYQYSNPYIYAT